MTRFHRQAAAFVSILASGLLLAGASAGAADPAAGEALYKRCVGCHSIERNRTGPKHKGLFGRKAGSVEGFRYSKALAESDIVWTDETLDRFLENPRAMVPGTTMTYAGIRDPEDRADLIAYLREATRTNGEAH